MRYDLEDLLSIYADQNEITIDEAFEQYDHGQISKVDLLGAYLASSLWSIFEALGGVGN